MHLLHPNRYLLPSRVSDPCSTASTATLKCSAWILKSSLIADGNGTRLSELHTDGSSTEAKYYYTGGLYEVTDTNLDGIADATTKYYSIAGQSVAMDDGSGLQFMLAITLVLWQE